MINEITKRIDALPPLPQTLVELKEFQNKSVQETSELLSILEKDPLIISTLLKVANSAMFGFRHRVETAKKAIELIGINFTLSIAFGSAIKSSLNTNLECYNLTSDHFVELANMSSNLLSKWLGRWDAQLKDRLLMPVFLQETGKFIIADVAKEYNKVDAFYNSIKNDFTKISQVEQNHFEATSSQITAMIFEQWGFGERFINIIKYVDDIKHSKPEYLQEAQILHIIKILTNPIEPLSDRAIEIGINLAQEYKLDTNSLKKAIKIMQDRILEQL